MVDIRQVLENLRGYRQKLTFGMENQIYALRQRMKQYEMKLEYGSPAYQIQEKRTRLMELEDRIGSAMENQIFRARQNLNIYIERMKGLSPLNKLNQGFSYVENEANHSVTCIGQVKPGDNLNIQVTDGRILAKVLETIKEERSMAHGRR